MASANDIRAGGGYFELFAKNNLNAGLASAKASLDRFGSMVSTAGAGLLKIGLAFGGVGALAVTEFANYEQALADLRAASNPTAAELADVEAAIERISKSTGQGPVEVTQAFSELLKAGVPLQAVLGGIGETAVKFARVSGMPMAEATIAMVDAMNVFAREGLNATQVVNIMNRAADSSTISLRDVSQSFATGASTMALFDQTMLDTAAAIAILGNNGIKAADAGTLLKTWFLRMAGSGGEARDAMRELGLSITDANGAVVPMVEILRRLDVALAGRGPEERRRLLTELAGDRGFRGLAILVSSGTDGWRRMETAMESSLSVGEKFTIMTDSLWGGLKRTWTHVQFVGIEIGRALAPSLRVAADAMIPFLNGLQALIAGNRGIVSLILPFVAGTLALGVGLLGLGFVIGFVSFGLGGLLMLLKGLFAVAAFVGSAIMFVFTPVGAIVAAIAVGVGLAIYYFDELKTAVLELWYAFRNSALFEFLTKLGRIVLALGIAMIVIAVVAAKLAWFAALYAWDLLVETTKIIARAFLWMYGGIVAALIWVGSKFLQFARYIWDLLEPVARVGQRIADAFAAAFGQIADSATRAWERVSEQGLRAWEIIKTAYSAGDWNVIWETIKTAGLIAWNELSFVAVGAFYSIKDLLIDSFDSVWHQMHVGFVRSWGQVRSLALQGIAQILRGLAAVSVGPLRDLYLAQAGSYEIQARSILTGTVSTPGSIANQLQPIETQRWFATQLEGVVREMRDSALAAGHNEEAHRLRGELDFLQAEADTAAILDSLHQEYGLGVHAREISAGAAEAGKDKFSSMGGFSSDAVMGLFGGETQTDRMERIELQVLEALRLNNRLLGQMAARPGLAF